jgi:hypothetical protein
VIRDYACKGTVYQRALIFFSKYPHISMSLLKKTKQIPVGWFVSSSEFQALLLVLTPQHPLLEIHFEQFAPEDMLPVPEVRCAVNPNVG